MSTPVPTYLSPGESYSTILTRLLAYLSKYDTSDGGTWRMLEAPVALELDRWRNKAIQYVADLFLDSATLNGLIAWGQTLSLPQKQPTPSIVTLNLVGTPNATVLAGLQVATKGTSSASAVVFTTTADCTLDSSGNGSVSAQ